MKPLTPTGVRAVAANGGGQRVLALLQIGEMDLAEDEMRSLLQGANPDLAAGLLGIAQSFQLPSISLGLGVMAEQRDNVQADTDLYPLVHWAPKGGFTMDRALLFALARQELGFNVRARSSAGAARADADHAEHGARLGRAAVGSARARRQSRFGPEISAPPDGRSRHQWRSDPDDGRL